MGAADCPFGPAPAASGESSGLLDSEVRERREDALRERLNLLTSPIHDAEGNVFVNAVLGEQFDQPLDVVRRPGRRPLFKQRLELVGGHRLLLSITRPARSGSWRAVLQPAHACPPGTKPRGDWSEFGTPHARTRLAPRAG